LSRWFAAPARIRDVVYRYDLTLGLPHTNRRGLWEPLLLMHAGHFQWQSIASAIGRPLSELRTVSGGEVYAAFYYIEERIPELTAIESFGLDATMRFSIALRSFKNIAVEGLVSFDRADVLGDAAVMRVPDPGGLAHPFIRFGNIFITPVRGNSELRVAPPANADFSAIPALANEDNPYHLIREAKEAGSFGLIQDGWPPLGNVFDFLYEIDADRDTNGAGLVYFVHYVTAMERAERAMFEARPLPRGDRSLSLRRTGYYGNADPHDTIRVRISAYQDPRRADRVGLRYTIERQQDGQLICLSEALKVVV
jgi:probable biosynthetic protein (TIGR04098 family)